MSPTTGDRLILDREFLLLQVDHDLEFLPHVIGIFLKESRTRLAEIADAMAKHDLGAVAAAAHSLKGSTGGIGAQRAHHAAHLLERAALLANAPAALTAWSDLQHEAETLLSQLAESA